MNQQEAINLFIRVSVADEARQELRSKLLNNAIESRKEPGCQLFDFFEDEVEPRLSNQLYLFEQWDSQDCLNSHQTQPHFLAVRELLQNPTLVRVDAKRLIEELPAENHCPQEPSDPNTVRIVIVVLETKPEDSEGLMTAMAEAIPQARRASGNLSFQLFQAADDLDKQQESSANLNTFVLFEKWESPAAHEAHLATDYTKKLHDFMIPRLTRPLMDQRYLLRDIKT